MRFAAKKRKPDVEDESLWDIESTGEPVSNDAIEALARLLIDRAKRNASDRRAIGRQASSKGDEGRQ